MDLYLCNAPNFLNIALIDAVLVYFFQLNGLIVPCFLDHFSIVEWFYPILSPVSENCPYAWFIRRTSRRVYLAHRVTSWYPVGKSVVLFLSSAPNGFSTSEIDSMLAYSG